MYKKIKKAPRSKHTNLTMKKVHSSKKKTVASSCQTNKKMVFNYFIVEQAYPASQNIEKKNSSTHTK